MPTLRRGSAASPHHSFSSPSAPRFRQPDIAYHGNDAASIMSRPENSAGEQKALNALVNKLVHKLPCNSGIQLTILEQDAGVKATVQSILQLSRLRLPLVAHALVGALETLSKYTNPYHFLADISLEVLHSQLYLLHVLNLCFSTSWRLHAQSNAPQSSDVPRPWSDPPPFDESLAKYVLSVLLVYTRLVSLESDFLDIGAQSIREQKGTGSGSSSSWGKGAATSSGYSLGTKFLLQHSYPLTQQQPSAERHISPNCTTTTGTIAQMTKCVARAVFYLSAANWPLVFSQTKKRIQHLTTTIEDAPDLNELRLVEWVNVDQSRLSQLLAEVTNAFLHTKRPAQSTVATMLRKAIRNWISINPKEYELFIETGRKMDGGPDALFDVLYSMSDLGSFSNSKRTRAFYPLMSMLLVLCPDTLKRLVMGESARGSSSFSKKISFLDSFKKGLNSSKAFEACAICYVELMSAGMALTPRLDGSGIRSFIPDIQNDLKNALFYSPLSNEISDMNVLVEGLVALYRANPTTTGGLLFPKLWNDSESSKVVAVKACILMAVEGGRLPWHPPVVDIMREVGPSIRGLIKAHAMSVTADRLGPRRPRGSIELPGAQNDLAYEILSLYALEPSFALINVRLDNSSDSVSSIFLTLASLLVIPNPEIIRTATAKTSISLINHICEGCGQGESMKNLGHNAAGGLWQMLLDVGRQMLFAFHDGDYDEITISATSMRDMLYAIIKLAEAYPEVLFPSSKAQPAAMVVSAAGYVCIVSPDVEQTALTLPSFMALGKLTMLAHRSASGEVITNAYSQYPQSRAVVFERLAVLPTAVGRQQQQRMIRRTLRPMAKGSTLTTSVWVGLFSIWKSLTTKIIAFDAGNTMTSRDRRRVMTADIEGLDEQESKEWQNLTYFLCSITSVGICTSPPSSLSSAIGKEGLLPAAYDQDISEPLIIVEGFIKQCVELLVTNSVAIRESVKTALGSEYPTSMCGLLVTQISKLLSHAFGPTGVNVSDAFNTLVEQSVNILRLQIDRMGPDNDMPTVQVEMGELLHKLGQYIQRLGRSDLAIRLKTRYCQLVEVALSKKDHVVAENGLGLKNSVMEWLCEWSVDTSRVSDDDVYSTAIESHGHSQRELDHACLKAMVPVTEGLVLRLGGEEAEDPQRVLKSRLFYRHYHHLVKVIEKTNNEETQSTNHPPSIQGQPSTRSGTQEDAPTLAILALSNLLSSNIDVGLKHCLALGYHDDPALRTVFMQLLTNILQQGTRFGGLAAKRASLAPKLFLENLTSTNMALALAMVDVCSQSGPDMDELSTLLFRVFEGNGTLLGFMRLLIEREVTVTNHESELFRANSLTMRMITMFAKTYGYNYVRATLQPLVLSLAEKPAECSFELDPRKASATDDIDRNADHLKLMCQALLDLICASTPKVPLMFRALCHHIWEVVDDRFPDSRHSAVGSFIFLRFFCPAIVSPDTIDLDSAPDNAQTRRALLLITKVIQNLANNVVFKEPHMKMLNPFLSDNIKQVTKFLSDVAIRPKTVDVQNAAKAFQEDAEKSQDLDGDDAIIHRFVFKNQTKLEGSLTGMPKSYHHSTSASKVARTECDGKDALEKLRAVMKATGPPADTNLMSASARALAYDEFMQQNQGRNVDSVKDVFYEGPASQNGRRIFYFVVAKVALIDYDLLAYHVFKSLDNVTEYFDVVIDLTDFSSSTELPMTWLKKSLQICPSAILSSIFTLVLYNPNTYSRKRLKRIIAELLTVSPPVGKNVAAASSPGELVDHIQFTSLALPEHTMVLAYEADHVFTNLVCLSEHGMQVPVVVKLGHDCLQVASWRKQDLTTNIRSYIIDVVKLADIDDIVTSGGIPTDQLVIKHSQNETLIFVSRKRNEMAHIVKSARARLRDAPINSRALRPSDVPATLLNVALLNLSSDNETLRMGAYILVQELSRFFKYDLAARVLTVSAGLTIPNNSLSWVRDLSNALANSATHLTLEFLKEWTIGFSKADIIHKTASLHYIGPWLLNLDQFSRPTRDDAEESVKQVKEVIRSFISITVAERRRLHLTIQEHLWSPLAKSHGSLVDIMIYELIYGAIDAGLGSDKTECIADILVSISSTNVRGKVVARLRKSLAQTYLRPSNHLTENATWNEVCALARITLALGFNPTTALDTQLFLPETFHVITLLLGAGPLVMRQTVYGLLVSIIHSLASNATSGEMDGPALVKLSNRLSKPEMMTAFGVSQGHGHIELSGLPNKNETDVHLLDRVEEVSKFLGDVLTAGATSVDCANAWRARWMGLVAATCFQHNPATQPQAFTVLGFLVSDEVDDDLIYQILVAMSTALSHFAESHSILIISMLRCLSRIIPGLLPDSRYATSLFWLAVGVLQLGYIPLFAPALELLITALRFIHSASPDVPCAELMTYVLDSRSVVANETQKLDHVCGVSFDVDISFALVAIIYKGVRHPSTRKLTIEVLLDLLRMSASPAQQSGEDEPSVAEEGIAYFVALLSIVANSPEEAKSVFLAAGLPIDEDAVDLGSIPIFSLLSVPDNRRAVLLISLVVALLSGSGGSDAEKVVLYRLLADASAELPEVVRMVYSSLIPRIMSTLGATSNISIINSSTVILERALMDDTYAFPNLSAIPSTDSSTSLPHGHGKPYASSISSTPSVVAGTKEQLLEDIGMKGLGELAFPQVKADRLTMMARWVASLIENFTL
ncbi:neurofibromin 1 [Cryptococcus wingfieldii CBS 7118]|uniref:Neurofibromin 1 n=1 Tax=Cryptococcus wingfieldii CBS 7118 TaxID=1295528 RepID=A0A1E3J6U6_9TREE|nr:neurofibromin 1 [Cryptococcus wingfieldii CBS 7118]ODN95826.1 neurofibromin 1 [Cryptococcus wingfieldii CBS 7118]